jgi:hypothetical protein
MLHDNTYVDWTVGVRLQLVWKFSLYCHPQIIFGSHTASSHCVPVITLWQSKGGQNVKLITFLNLAPRWEMLATSYIHLRGVMLSVILDNAPSLCLSEPKSSASRVQESRAGSVCLAYSWAVSLNYVLRISRGLFSSPAEGALGHPAVSVCPLHC